MKSLVLFNPRNQPGAPELFDVIASYEIVPKSFENAFVYVNSAFVAAFLPKKMRVYSDQFATTHFPKTTLALQKKTKRAGIQK